MASRNQVAGKTKTKDETPKKTQGLLSNKEKKDLEQKIQNLQDENQRLRLENVMFKNNFDLREIIKVLTQKGVTEVDEIEFLKDIVKTAVQEADEKHSAEKKYMEKKHEKEIEKLSPKLQGADQQQPQLNGASKHSQETDDELAKYRAQNEKLEREVVSLKADKEKLKPEKESLTKKLTTTDELLSKKDNEITDLRKQLANLTTRNQDAISKTVKSDDMDVQLRETTKEKEKAIRNQDAISKTVTSDDIHVQLRETTKEKEKAIRLKKVEEAKDNLNQQVQALQKENNELKYRLKESKSTQPTFNNQSIAELSDAFRPTKLSERYSQLYDNMWTDAFEEHSGKKEEDIIQMLRKRLLGSYEFCENVCREFTVQLTNSTLALPNSKPKNRDIPIGYKKQLQEIKKNFGVFLRNDVKESYRKQNAIEGGDKTKNYIDACVELCWLMVIQDPPVVLETPAPKDSTFDTNTYMTYTTTGTKVDFVVWPALRLHHGGPLLFKGVAQGKK